MREHRFVLVALVCVAASYYGCASGEMVGGNSGKGGSTSTTGSGGKGGQNTTSGAGGQNTTSGSGGSFTTSGSGGTFSTGTGGSSTTGAGGIVGTTGAGGSTMACAPTAPSMALITDFSMTTPGTGTTAFTYQGGGVMGGATTYGGSAGPMVSVASGAMKISMSTAAGAAAQYVGAVLYFNGCVDASAYKGVHFKIGGTVSGCTIQYSTNDSPHTATANDPKGVCNLASCYAPQKPLDTIPATPTDMTILWADATSMGSPATPVEAGRVTAIQWQFTIPMGTGMCTASLTIDDVGFAM